MISQQLTLWTQRGSQAIRGSLLVIPIEDSLLYVEPLYLAASESGSLPELRRVIVAFGNRLVMEPDLDSALAGLFGGRALQATTPATEREVATGSPGAAVSLSRQALEHYRRAQAALREGQWEAYGAELKQLERTLEALAKTP